MRAPTQARWLTSAEWTIVTDVFGSTLPYQQRVFLTDGLGGGSGSGAPFTIPTSAISLATIPAVITAGFNALIANKTGPVGRALSTLHNYVGTGPTFLGTLPSQILGTVNLGYFVSVGPTAYPDMTVDQGTKDLLVHEMTHVWQGKNSTSSMTYVINSVFHQCQGIFGAGSRGTAYGFTAGSPWHSYNAEQQAKIVESWYSSGKPTSGDLWEYIRDYVRKGKA
jgi:hypothetical protein